jgi:hypothetical protein
MPDRQPSSDDSKVVPPAAHWPNPAQADVAASEEEQKRPEGEDDAARLERTDPKSLHSAAPGDGTGITGTVPPA